MSVRTARGGPRTRHQCSVSGDSTARTSRPDSVRSSPDISSRESATQQLGGLHPERGRRRVGRRRVRQHGPKHRIVRRRARVERRRVPPQRGRESAARAGRRRPARLPGPRRSATTPAPCRSSRLHPADPAKRTDPGTASTARPQASAWSAVLNVPLGSAASTTRTAADSAAMMRLRAGKWPRIGGTPHASSETTAPGAAAQSGEQVGRSSGVVDVGTAAEYRDRGTAPPRARPAERPGRSRSRRRRPRSRRARPPSRRTAERTPVRTESPCASRSTPSPGVRAAGSPIP